MSYRWKPSDILMAGRATSPTGLQLMFAYEGCELWSLVDIDAGIIVESNRTEWEVCDLLNESSYSPTTAQLAGRA